MTDVLSSILLGALILFAIEPTVFAKPVAEFVTAVQQEMTNDTSKEAIDRVCYDVDEYRGQIPRQRASDMIWTLAAERDALKAALSAFDPHIIGHGPSTDMQMLHDAQMNARAILEET